MAKEWRVVCYRGHKVAHRAGGMESSAQAVDAGIAWARRIRARHPHLDLTAVVQVQAGERWDTKRQLNWPPNQGV
jgi:hypothetical protein